MKTPCVTTIMLNKHMDKLDAEQREEDFITDYVYSRLDDYMDELATDENEWDGSVILEALQEGDEKVVKMFAEAVKQAQKKHNEYGIRYSLENLGGAIYGLAHALLEKRATEYLEKEARNIINGRSEL